MTIKFGKSEIFPIGTGTKPHRWELTLSAEGDRDEIADLEKRLSNLYKVPEVNIEDKNCDNCMYKWVSRRNPPCDKCYEYACWWELK